MKNNLPLITLISVFSSFCLRAEEPLPILSKRLQTGNQLSDLIKLGGIDNSVNVDGKYTYDKKSKFIESVVSFKISNQQEKGWSNALKSKFQLTVAKSAQEIVFGGSESKYTNFNGWTVLVDHSAKFNKATKTYEIAFWALVVRGDLKDPEKIKNMIKLPEKKSGKPIIVDSNDAVAVYLGSISIADR